MDNMFIKYTELEDSGAGYCPTCGLIEGDYVEPDAEEYECPECGEYTLMGIMNALMAYTDEISLLIGKEEE